MAGCGVGWVLCCCCLFLPRVSGWVYVSVRTVRSPTRMMSSTSSMVPPVVNGVRIPLLDLACSADGMRRLSAGRGYASLGMIFERKDLPVGVSKRRVTGLDRVFLNCAACHTNTVRDTPQSEPRLIAGMPSIR